METPATEEEMRWPLREKRRRDARDLKLAAREEAIADQQSARKRKCPCNICMGENFSMQIRAVVRDHLKLYGRHPYHRGSTQVSGFSIIRIVHCLISMQLYCFCAAMARYIMLKSHEVHVQFAC